MTHHQHKFPLEMSAYFTIRWHTKALWSHDLPIQTAPIKNFVWHLDYPFWSSRPPEPLFDLCPKQVIKDPTHHPYHYDRLLNADTQYPLSTTPFENRLVILDGIHRLAHLTLQKATTVTYQIIPRELL